MKKYISLLLTIAMLFALSACQTPAEGADTTLPAETDAPIPEEELTALFAEFTAALRTAGSMAELSPEYSLLNSYPEWTGDAAEAEIEKIYSELLEDKLSADSARALISSFKLLNGTEGDVTEYLAMTEYIDESRCLFANAEEYLKSGQNLAAAVALSGLAEEDEVYLNKAKELIAQNKESIEKGISEQVDSFLSANAKEPARQFLTSLAELYGDDDFIRSQLEKLQ